MKRFFIFAVIVWVSWILSSTIHHFPLLSIRWEPVWLVVLYGGLTWSWGPGFLAVLLIGLGEEALGAPFHGPLVISYLIAFLFLRFAREHLFFEGKMSVFLWVFLLTLAQKGIQDGGLVWLGFPFISKPIPLVATALLQAATALVFFPFLKKIETQGA